MIDGRELARWAARRLLFWAAIVVVAAFALGWLVNAAFARQAFIIGATFCHPLDPEDCTAETFRVPMSQFDTADGWCAQNAYAKARSFAFGFSETPALVVEGSVVCMEADAE